MHSFRCSLAALLVFAAASPRQSPAQAPTIRTGTAVGVFAGSDQASIPAGTVILQPTGRSASQAYSGCTASAVVNLSPDGTRGARLRGQAAASSPLGGVCSGISAGMTTSGGSPFDSYTIDLVFPGAQRGNMNVDLRGTWESVVSAGWPRGLTVDVVVVGTTTIRADFGSRGAAAGVRRAIPVQFTNGLTVQIRVHGSVQSTLGRTERFSYDAHVWFEPQGAPPAQFTSYAPRCGGFPSNSTPLSGSDMPVGTTHFMRFETAFRAPPFTPVVLVFGVSSSPVPIPGTSCSLQLVPVNWVVTTATFPFGLATWRLTIPGPVPTATVYAQAVLLDPRSYATSNALRVDFP